MSVIQTKKMIQWNTMNSTSHYSYKSLKQRKVFGKNIWREIQNDAKERFKDQLSNLLGF